MKIPALKFTKTAYQKSDFYDKIRQSPNLFHQLFDKEKYFHRQFVWEMTRDTDVKIQKDSFLIFETIAHPKKEILGVLTEQTVIDCLNDDNCFDFDYEPTEGDTLRVRAEYIYPRFKKHHRPFLVEFFMYFIFENGCWQSHFPVYIYESITLGKGRLIVDENEVF